MNEHRWKIWRAAQRAGQVRYRMAEFKCAECKRFHTVTAKRRNIRYDERELMLEDLVLDALRTSATHGCQHKKVRMPVE